VLPGDQIIFKVEIKRRMKGIWRFAGNAYVDEELAATAELMCAYKGI